MPRQPSIFENNPFINEIEGLLNKKAQDVNLNANYNLALKMLNDLASAGAPASVRPAAGEDNSQPSQSDLYSLDAFVNYLKNKNFTFGQMPGSPNGLTIVAPFTEGDNIAQGYTKYQSKSPAGLFQVNKEGLIEALKQFQNLSSKSGNLYFQELVGKLIDDAKMDRQLSLPAESLVVQDEKAGGDDALKLSDDSVLDTINTKVNLVQELYPDQRNGRITVGDLRDDAFPTFVSKFHLSKDGNTYSNLNFGADDSPQNPICSFMSYLHDRASKLQLPGNLKRYYISQLERFMGSKSCAIQPAAGEKEERSEQGSGQGQSEQGAYQNVSVKEQSIQTSLQQGGSSELLFPFDLSTNVISIDRFEQFLQQVTALTVNPVFVAEMAPYVMALRSGAHAANGSILNWQQHARDTAYVDGGFALTGMNIDSFTNALVQNQQTNQNQQGNPYNLARDLLTILYVICGQLSNLVRTLGASPTLSEMVGEEVFREQAQKGQDYVLICQALINRIPTGGR